MDLNVYYDSYWVSVSAPNEITFSAASVLDDKIDEVNYRVDRFNTVLGEYTQTLTAKINNTEASANQKYSCIESLENKLNSINVRIDARTTISDVQIALVPVENRVTKLENKTIDFSPYALKSEVTTSLIITVLHRK